jgi:hypothetical protein
MNVRDHVERLKAKPEHIRKRIAVGTSVGITGVVATVWFFTLLFGGTLSLATHPTIYGSDGTVADTNGNGGTDGGGTQTNAVAETNAPFSQLLGAVGISTAKQAPAALQVEDKAPAAPTTTDPTVIPF